MSLTVDQMNRISGVRYGFTLNGRQDRHPAAEDADRPCTERHLLDRLMRSIARDTYSEVSDGMLNALSGLAECEKTKLGTLVSEAVDAFKAIRETRVRGIVDDAAEASFTAAADAHFKLADELREVAGKCRGSRRDLSRTLDDLSLKCDSRGSEILTLFMEIRTFVEKGLVNDQAVLEARTGDLLKGMAGSMHGNYSVDQFGEEFVDGLERKLAAVADSPTADQEALSRLSADFASMCTSLDGNAGPVMDPDIRAKLTEHLGNFPAEPGAYVDRAVRKFIDDYIRKAEDILTEGWNQNGPNAPGCRIRDEVLGRLEGIRDKGFDGDMEADINGLREYIKRKENFERLFRCVKGSLVAKNNKVKDKLANDGLAMVRSWALVVALGVAEELCKRRKAWAETGACMQQPSGEDVVNAFLRNGRFSSILEARVSGADEEMLDPRLCDRNVTGDEVLGKGVFNTVRKITYRVAGEETKSFAFKTDFSGRAGLLSSSVGNPDGYADTQQCVKLNKATCEVAELLGLTGLVVKCHATVHNGEYGLLMEMAPGSANEGTGGRLREELLSKPRDEAVRKSFGALARQLNDLRWLCIATGQGDLNKGNYFIDLGADGQMPQVKAIDMDLAFVPYFIGVGKFKVDYSPEYSERFFSKLEDACLGFFPKKENKELYESLCEKIRSNEFIVDTQAADIDNHVLCALRTAFGFHSVKIPKQMSSELCTKLKSLTDAEVEKFAAEKLTPNVDKPDAVDATVQRLKDLREIAGKYERENLIIGNEDWRKAEVLEREINCDIKLGKYNLSYSVAAAYVSSDLMARDIFGMGCTQMRLPA